MGVPSLIVRAMALLARGGEVSAEALEALDGEMVPVSSSVIAAVGYTARTSTLEIEMVSGTSYTYEGVPIHTWAGLMSAPSKGRYYDLNIKGRF